MTMQSLAARLRFTPTPITTPKIDTGAPQVVPSTGGAIAAAGGSAVIDAVSQAFDTMLEKHNAKAALARREAEDRVANEMKMRAAQGVPIKALAGVSAPASGGLSYSTQDPLDSQLGALRLAKLRQDIQDNEMVPNPLYYGNKSAAGAVASPSTGARTSTRAGGALSGYTGPVTEAPIDINLPPLTDQQTDVNGAPVQEEAPPTTAPASGGSLTTELPNGGGVKEGPEIPSILPALPTKEEINAAKPVKVPDGTYDYDVIAETANGRIAKMKGVGTVLIPNQVRRGDPPFKVIKAETAAESGQSKPALVFDTIEEGKGYLAKTGLDGEITPTADGKFSIKELKAPRALTEREAKDDGYYKMAKFAEQELSNSKFDPTAAMSVITKMAADSDVGYLIGTKTGAIGKDAQDWLASMRLFVNSINRRDSGATVTPQEIKEAQNIYFPRAGEDKASIEAKRKKREAKIRSIGDTLPKHAPSKIEEATASAATQKKTGSDIGINDYLSDVKIPVEQRKKAKAWAAELSDPNTSAVRRAAITAWMKKNGISLK